MENTQSKHFLSQFSRRVYITHTAKNKALSVMHLRAKVDFKYIFSLPLNIGQLFLENFSGQIEEMFTRKLEIEVII